MIGGVAQLPEAAAGVRGRGWEQAEDFGFLDFVFLDAGGAELPEDRELALALPMARAARPQLGIVRNASNEKARRMLGWTPRPAQEAIIASAESLLGLGLVRT